MPKKETFLEHLTQQGVSRRSFMKFCTLTASSLALPAGAAKVMAETLAGAPRPTVIWISGQECTGCSESLLRSFEPSVEGLILNHISLEYHNTLMAPSGETAEASRTQAMNNAFGQYILVVDGAIPEKDGGAWSVIGGKSALDVVREAAEGAALILSIGNCSAFGGLPAAEPNPTDARGVQELMEAGSLVQRPLINVPGCPPMPEVITGVIAYYLVNGTAPELDTLLRPKVYFGQTVHDSCTRLPHFIAGNFAKSFDDMGARQGFCLLELGCKGPLTFNACSILKWNQGTSFPMHSGHGCIGCSEPGFWDRPGGFYSAL